MQANSTFRIPITDALLEALEADASRCLRPTPWHAAHLLRKALGLPEPALRPRQLLLVGERAVGAIENGVLSKRVRLANQLRKPPAWAMDSDHLDQLRDAGGDAIVLTADDASVWRATLEDFDEHALTLDRGHGRQRALPLERWQVRRPGADE